MLDQDALEIAGKLKNGVVRFARTKWRWKSLGGNDPEIPKTKSDSGGLNSFPVNLPATPSFQSKICNKCFAWLQWHHTPIRFIAAASSFLVGAQAICTKRVLGFR